MFFFTEEGFGIEMVQALDKPYAVDIVQALQPGAVPEAVPATSLNGKDRLRLLWDWMKALEQSMASKGASDPRSADPRGLRARVPRRLNPRSAADCAPAVGPARAAASGDRRRSDPRHRGKDAAAVCCSWRTAGRRRGGSGRPWQWEWWPWRRGRQDATTAPRSALAPWCLVSIRLKAPLNQIVVGHPGVSCRWATCGAPALQPLATTRSPELAAL